MGVVDITGKAVIPFSCERVSHFSEGLALVLDTNDKWCFIDKTGTAILHLDYDAAGYSRMVWRL